MRFRKQGAPYVDIRYIIHIIQIDHPVHLRAQQRGIMKNQGRVPLYQRDGMPTQGIRPRGGRKTQEGKRLASRLGKRTQRDTEEKEQYR